MFWTLDRKITQANDKFLEMVGYSREDLDAGPINGSSLTPPEYADIDEAALKELKMYGVLKRPYEKEYIRKDGTQFPVLLAGAMLDDNGGENVGFVLDISDLKHAKAALLKANRQISLMTGIIRHDINNEIFLLLSLLDLEKSRSADSDFHDWVGKIGLVIKNIRSNLEFFNVIEKLADSEPRWLDVEKILVDLEIPESITLLSTVHGLELFANIMISKVFFNLLDNSVRHGLKVSEIRVSAHQNDEGLILVWEDNGVGIPLEQKDQVFEQGIGKNTGFGLFLVREILSTTDISIQETGAPGKGARFEIRVPHGKYRYIKRKA